MTSTTGGSERRVSVDWTGAIAAAAAAAHERVRRRRSFLARSRRRPVRLVLQEGTLSISSTGRCQRRSTGASGGSTASRRPPCVPQADVARQLLRHAVRRRRRSHGAAARPVRRRNALGDAGWACVRMVAFESSNTVTNAGRDAWQPKSGLVSVWILGMFTPSRDDHRDSICARLRAGARPIVNDAYFGKVPADRLTQGSVVFFRGDGQYRSKIGLSPPRALVVRRQLRRRAARADAGAVHASFRRVELRELHVGDPARTLQGDVINSYNDGRPPRQAAARTLLRARDVVASSQPRSGPALHPRAPHGACDGKRERSRSAGRRDVEGGCRGNRAGLYTLDI